MAVLSTAQPRRSRAPAAELRETSQLIIVTHQKRSMEVADTLYGITMRGNLFALTLRDLVVQLVSQRLQRSSARPRAITSRSR